MDILATLEKSANATAAAARGVRPDQLAGPTPCSEWNVEELMNHLIGSLEYFKARGESHSPGPLQPAPRTTYEQTVKHLQGVTDAPPGPGGGLVHSNKRSIPARRDARFSHGYHGHE
jgi:Mycothiol maleylpyruvate isomerase N-terminal domain